MIFPMEDDATPFPTPDITPPVMKIYFVVLVVISPISLHEMEKQEQYWQGVLGVL
jgi:hypothetical protein